MSGERQARMADRIQQILAERLEKGLRDPRLGFVTVTDVKVSGDLQHATVFYTVLGDDEEREATGEALKSATGYLRSEVAKNLNVRLAPSIEFVPDALPETAGHLDELLREAKQRDESVAQQAANAQPAGDANPYRDSATDDSSLGLDDELLDGDLGGDATEEY